MVTMQLTVRKTFPDDREDDRFEIVPTWTTKRRLRRRGRRLRRSDRLATARERRAMMRGRRAALQCFARERAWISEDVGRRFHPREIVRLVEVHERDAGWAIAAKVGGPLRRFGLMRGFCPGDGVSRRRRPGPVMFAGASVEGPGSELLAIAAAIRARGEAWFHRCAVDARGARVTFTSPRNGRGGAGTVTHGEAAALAAQIEALCVPLDAVEGPK
jgi:hypothetical protein